MHRRNAASLSNGQIIYRIVSHDVKSILEWWLLWKILDWAWGVSTTGAIVTAAVSVLSRYRGLSWQREPARCLNSYRCGSPADGNPFGHGSATTYR
jgi:hypothetical protein